MPDTGARFDPLDAVLFDLDGVLTPTAEAHMRAWARLFEPYLAEHGAAPYASSDYFDHIDGKPRYEGVKSLLVSRGIDPPFGDPSDSPETDTVCGLGNRKNSVFTAVLATEGVVPYPGSVAFLDALAERGGVAVAVVSSSKNARAVLAASGLLHRFAVVVDGVVAAEHGIIGKVRAGHLHLRGRVAGRAGCPSCGRRGCPLRRGSRPGRGVRPRPWRGPRGGPRRTSCQRGRHRCGRPRRVGREAEATH